MIWMIHAAEHYAALASPRDGTLASCGSESALETTDRLFRETFSALDALAKHLEKIGLTDQMYQVNAIYKKLWNSR